MENIRFLTIPEAAEILRVHTATIRRMVWRRTLPSVRVGRMVRVPERAIRDLEIRAVERPGSRVAARGK